MIKNLYTKLILSLILTTLTFLLFSLKLSSNISAGTDILNPWEPTTDLGYPIASHVSFIENNKISVLAGATSVPSNVTSYSTILSAGELDIWNSGITLPKYVYWHSLAFQQTSNKKYIVGGAINVSSDSISDVYLADITSDISSSFIPLTPLPKELDRGAAVVIDNRLYFAGGTKHEANLVTLVNQQIWFVDINPIDGTIGEWKNAGLLPTPLNEFGMVSTSNGKIIVIGGTVNAFSTATDKVYELTVGSDGKIASWINGPVLPNAIRRFGVTKVGNYIVVSGGADGTDMFSGVYYAEIDSTGSITNWVTSSYPMPETICCGALVGSNSHLYYTGGVVKGKGYQNKVYRSKLNISLPTPTPTPIPLPTPSPTPTPIPTPTPLNVLNLKQYNPLWGNQIYDHLNATIRQFGCALTSASMVLKYFGHSYANPDILNNWLTGQNDGYLANGLVNWLAVTRYSKINSSLLSPTLEYRRLAASNETLINELTEGRPVILKEPGHFVVAKSQTSDSFGINDPGYDDRTTLVPYGNIFLAINSFRPTFTDLSYILLVLDGDKNIKVFDPAGNEITGYSFIEEPLVDDAGGSEKSGKSLMIFQYPTPLSGNYKVEVTGPSGTYSLNSYLYKTDGSVTINSYQGLIKEGQTDNFLLSFGGASQSTVPVITIDSLIDDLDNAYSLGLITKKTVYQSFKQEFQNVKKMLQKNGKKQAIRTLTYIKNDIAKNTPRYIKQPASDILRNNIEALISSL